MADDRNNPGKVLRGGEFYSQVAASERHEHVVLSELRQPHPRQVPQHEHELAYFTVVLDGDYAEGDRRGLTELHPFMAIFNPAGVAHTGLIGQTGASLFTIELRPEHLRELDFRLPSYPMVDPGTGAMLWPGLRLYSAFKSRTADALVLESHVMEMLGAIAGFRLRDRTAPHWFHRVRDRLRQEFRDGLRFSDLAAEAGVHPVHLARFFRLLEGQTPGEYVQRLRVQAACGLLRDPEATLAGIAAECGFADQSHFTRTFKRLAGATPGAFRKTCLEA